MGVVVVDVLLMEVEMGGNCCVNFGASWKCVCVCELEVSVCRCVGECVWLRGWVRS